MKSVLPVAGIVDTIGSPTKSFEAGYFKAIYDDQNRPVAFIPIDGSAIQTGLIGADRINQLNGATQLVGGIRSLAAISNDAATGAGDPVPRINAGGATINGPKITINTLPPEALNPALKLLHLLLIGTAGGIQTDDYDATHGFLISKATIAINAAAAIFKGIMQGTIAIAGRFSVDNTGIARWADPANAPAGLTIGPDGSVFAGSDNYADAPFQVDFQGNVYVSDTPESLSIIDLGAISTMVKAVQASQAGGQFSGNVTLTPLTRGADIYYTTDGSDPSLVTNVNRHLYVNPVAINTAGGPVTLKAVAYKLGYYGAISSWTFTLAANAVASPIANPIAGYYKRTTALPVAFSTGTAGATMKYTVDGTDPSPVNGTIYAAPVNVPLGSTNYEIRIYAVKPGLVDSPPISYKYTVKRGKSGGGGGGGNEGGGQ